MKHTHLTRLPPRGLQYTNDTTVSADNATVGKACWPQNKQLVLSIRCQQLLWTNISITPPLNFMWKKGCNKDTQLFSQHKTKFAIHRTNVTKVVIKVHYCETEAERRRDWILDLLSPCSQEHDHMVAPRRLVTSGGRVGRQIKPPGENIFI